LYSQVTKEGKREKGESKSGGAYWRKERDAVHVNPSLPEGGGKILAVIKAMPTGKREGTTPVRTVSVDCSKEGG